MKITAKWGKWTDWVDKPYSRERSKPLLVAGIPVMTLRQVVVSPTRERDAHKRHLWAPGTYYGLHVPGSVSTPYYHSQRVALEKLGVRPRKKSVPRKPFDGRDWE